MSRTYKDRDRRNEKNIFSPKVFVYEDARTEIEEGLDEWHEESRPNTETSTEDRHQT